MTSSFGLGVGLIMLAALEWMTLAYFRGGRSTGMSKRAVLFGILVFGEICLSPVTGLGQASLLHELGACLVVLAAAWVVIKARHMTGPASASAHVIVALAFLSLAVGFAVHVTTNSSISLFHEVSAIALLCAAVWHAYEMRVYPLARSPTTVA
jgi:hypothetical protein